jgi:hypothetical protein
MESKLTKRFSGWLILSLSLLAGCAGQPSKLQPPRQTSQFSLSQKPNYALYAFPELLSYLGYLAQLQPSQRLAECEKLERFNVEAPSPGVRLHLAIALLLVPDCSGDAQQAIKLFTAESTHAYDLQSRSLLAYLTALAQHQYDLDKHHAELTRQLERQWRQANRSLNRRFQTCNEALKDTRAKLEALKAIERSLNPMSTP